MKRHLSLVFASLLPIVAGWAQVQSTPPRAPASASPESLLMSYAYDAAGRLIEVVYGGATTVRYTYDPAGNILSIVVTPMPLTAAPPEESRRDPVEALADPALEGTLLGPHLPILGVSGARGSVLGYSASRPGLSSSFFR